MTHELLETARFLANHETQASVRRAVSSAYYAVFHALAEAITGAIVDGASEPQLHATAYRSWDHAQVGKALVNSGEVEALKLIGAAFERLKAARERADYDPRFTFDPGEVHDLLSEATDAVEKIENLAKPDRTRLLIAAISRRGAVR